MSDLYLLLSCVPLWFTDGSLNMEACFVVYCIRDDFILQYQELFEPFIVRGNLRIDWLCLFMCMPPVTDFFLSTYKTLNFPVLCYNI